VRLSFGAIPMDMPMKEDDLTLDLGYEIDFSSEIDGNELRPQRDTADHLDENLNPINPNQHSLNGNQELPDGVPRPADGIIPDGFDLTTAEEQDDGQFCVYKTITLEGIEKMPVQQCVHRVDKQCYNSYVTQYTPTTEEDCSENFKKKCYIEYAKTAVTETIEKCYHPMERVCSPPAYGEVANEVCQTQYETSCTTRYTETAVVEDVEECNKVYKKVCEYVKVGYSTEQRCQNKPIKECATVPKTVYKKLPDTTCERVPFEACAPDNCQFIPSEPICHNKTTDIAIDVPEEVCDLQPQKQCKQVYRLVPKLYPQEVCEDVPREVCYTTLKNPREVKTPLRTKWCFKPEEEPEKSYPAPEVRSHSYPPPPPTYPPPPPPPYYPHHPLSIPTYPHHPSPYPPPPPHPVLSYPPPPQYHHLIHHQPKSYGFKIVGEPSRPILPTPLPYDQQGNPSAPVPVGPPITFEDEPLPAATELPYISP